jgi:hypothetical protein
VLRLSHPAEILLKNLPKFKRNCHTPVASVLPNDSRGLQRNAAIAHILLTGQWQRGGASDTIVKFTYRFV